jgi:NitT/TauT family transport system permease protein
MFRDQAFAVDVLASAGRIAFAFAVSALIAIPLGLLMSSFKIAEGLFEPMIDFIRYVPVPALLPIFVLTSGIGEQAKFLVLFFGTFFQLVLLVKDDADHMPPLYFDTARTMGANTFALFRDLLVPYLLPQMYDRLRVTLGWCWTYLVIAELIAVDRGMGHVIKEAQRFEDADRLFVCFITLGLIGLGTDFAAKRFFSVLFPYVPRTSLVRG